MDHLRHQKYKNKQLKNSTLELENNFKPINISVNDMDKFEIKELVKKRTFTKNTCYDWYDWLINYIAEPIKKPWAGLKTKLSKRVKTVYGGGKKQSEENIKV